MARTVDISAANVDGIVKDLDRTKYFCLNGSDTARRDLFNFALALGYKRGVEPDPITSKKETFVRTEYLNNTYYLMSSIYFKEIISDDLSTIDDIVNEDKVYKLAEEYANTGFDILRNHFNTDNDEQLSYILLAQMDELFEDNKDDLENLR